MIIKVPQGILALVLLTISVHCVAADNLLDIFDLAIENDPGLKAAQFDQKAQSEAHNQTLAKYFPRINFRSHVGKTSQNLKNTAIDPENVVGTSVFSEASAGIVLTQPLFNLVNFRSRDISEIKVVQAELKYRLAQEALLYRVAKGYFDVLGTQDALSFARAEKNAIARQLRQTKDRFKIGLTAVTDVHEAQARHDLAVAQEIKAESKLANSREGLRRITGKLHDELMLLKADTPLIPPTPANMDDWLAAARNQNLHIAAKKLQAEQVQKHMGVLRAGHYPTIDFTASYGYNKYGGPYSTESLDANVSLNFDMNIFEGNITASRIRQQKYYFEKLIQEIDAKEREILQQTRNAYLGVLAGMSYVKAISQALKSSEQALKATNAGFEVGTRTAIEVLNAQRDLFRNQRDYASARYEYVLNNLRLRIAVGMLSINDLEQVNSWLQ